MESQEMRRKVATHPSIHPPFFFSQPSSAIHSLNLDPPSGLLS